MMENVSFVSPKIFDVIERISIKPAWEWNSSTYDYTGMFVLLLLKKREFEKVLYIVVI